MIVRTLLIIVGAPVLVVIVGTGFVLPVILPILIVAVAILPVIVGTRLVLIVGIRILVMIVRTGLILIMSVPVLVVIVGTGFVLPVILPILIVAVAILPVIVGTRLVLIVGIRILVMIVRIRLLLGMVLPGAVPAVRADGRLSHLKQVHPLGTRNVQHIRHPLLQEEPRRHHQLRPVDGVHRLRGRDVIMRVGPHRHQHIHPGPLPRHVARYVAQDGGGGQNNDLGGVGRGNGLLARRPAPACRPRQNSRQNRRPNTPSESHIDSPSRIFCQCWRRISIMITNIIKESN